VVGGLVGIGIAGDLGDGGAELVVGNGELIAVEDASYLFHRLGEGAVRAALPVCDGSAPEDLAPVDVDPERELVGQA
jgi:hypothetical protein